MIRTSIIGFGDRHSSIKLTTYMIGVEYWIRTNVKRVCKPLPVSSRPTQHSVPKVRFELTCDRLSFLRCIRPREYFGVFCGNAGFRPLSTIVDDLLSGQSLFLTGCYFHRCVEQIGYAPIPVDFQSTASTKLAAVPCF